MKNLRLTLLLPLLLLMIMPDVSIAAGPVAKKIHAHRVIRRTAVVIIHAHKKVKETKNYTGDLARAIAHQKFARKLYRRGMYLRAIHHSRLARLYAIKSIKANKGTDPAEASFTPEEEELMKSGPSEAELTQELLKEMPGEPTKDEDVVNTAPDVDLGAKD